jgi:hypothetical protein
MASQNIRSGQTNKAAFVTQNKSKADEHRVQLTITEAVKRPHDSGAVSSIAKNVAMIP